MQVSLSKVRKSYDLPGQTKWTGLGYMHVSPCQILTLVEYPILMHKFGFIGLCDQYRDDQHGKKLSLVIRDKKSVLYSPE